MYQLKIVACVCSVILLTGAVGFWIGCNTEDYDSSAVASTPNPTAAATLMVTPSPAASPSKAPATPAPSPTVTMEPQANDVYLYPTEHAIISREELKTLLNETFAINNTYLNDMIQGVYGERSWLMDRTYSLTSVEEAMNYTLGDAKLPFSVTHDCDNFAAQLWGYWNQGEKSFAFGFASSGVHAFNFMVDMDLTVWIVEPFTNEFMRYRDIDITSNSTYVPYIYIV